MQYTNMTNQQLLEFGKANREKYLSAEPFPSGYFDGLFNEAVLNQILEEFPDMQRNPDLKYNDPNQVKLASNNEDRFGEMTKQFMHYLNSAPFLDFLSAITGIENLVPDPYFLGGGYHQILPGGFLKVHADFNKHQRNKLDRRLNVLVYLNKNWEESYGGHFQLWDRDMKSCKAKILPLFGRMAMFSTTDFSYHGHPDPLTCPPDRSRKSLAVYYYTNGRPEEEINAGLEEHSTLFRYRDGADNATVKQNKMKDFFDKVTPPVLRRTVKKITGV